MVFHKIDRKVITETPHLIKTNVSITFVGPSGDAWTDFVT